MNSEFKKEKPTSLALEAWHRLKRNKIAMIALGIIFIIVLTAIFAPFITPYEPNKQNLSHMLQSPNSDHLLGADIFGRDIFTRIIYGARTSLFISFFVVVISSGLGIILGSLAGYYKKFDIVIMRFIDVLSSVPHMLLAIALAAAFGAGVRNLIIALGISYTPSCVRIVRSTVLSIREQEYVEAATSIGANDFRIIFKHVVPNALSPIIVQSTLNVARTLISASTLSFLGLGVNPPTAEWGSMLSEGRYYFSEYPHMLVVPGMAIVITTYCFNLFGDGLRDALDPRLKN